MRRRRFAAGLAWSRLLPPEPVILPAATANPCYLTMPLPSDEHGHLTAAAEPILLPAAAKCSVIACGPGLGQGSGVTGLVIDLLARVTKPCVLDADGLNAVARTPESLPQRATPLSSRRARGNSPG